MTHRDRLFSQLAIDYDTSPEALRGGQNLFAAFSHDPRKRVFLNKRSELLRVLLLGDIAVFCCADEALRAALAARFSAAPAEWMLSIRFLSELNALLAPFGEAVSHQQLFFLPSQTLPQARTDLALRWYEPETLAAFRGDGRFANALGFLPDMPDMLAVAAEDDDALLGMAGASRDAEAFWQIGVDVLPSARHRGVASALTAALAREILRRGVLPFYGTAPSHIFSQRTALAAGFVPTWAELRTAPIKKEA